MADTMTRAQRSALMAKIRGRDTGPERAMRAALHGAGFRFRLRGQRLPGTPDIVLARHRIAVFVHGCFWHRHAGCRLASTPASNRAFWREKFRRNVQRDRRTARLLRARGWRVLTVWECQVRDAAKLSRALQRVVRMARVSAPARRAG
ncbi:MAG: DNA mismatch endonuclease Vsr [Phycisphaerales bacterium]